MDDSPIHSCTRLPAGLIFTSVLRSPLFWLALSALIAARIIADWPTPDNHIYLLVYWCLLLVLAMRSPLPEVTLKTGSRFLVAFAFLLAVLWKAALSPDYMDGRFFRITLLTDERFASVSMLIGGLTKQELKENRTYLMPLPEGAELLEPPRLIEPPALRIFAAKSVRFVLHKRISHRDPADGETVPQVLRVDYNPRGQNENKNFSDCSGL